MSNRRTIGMTLLGLGSVSAVIGVVLGFIPGSPACPPIFAGPPAGACPDYVDTTGGHMFAFLLSAVVLIVVGAQLVSKQAWPSETQFRIPPYGDDTVAAPVPESLSRGWYPDAHAAGRLRFFDGSIWTDDTMEG